jgi:hypothetical protein
LHEVWGFFIWKQLKQRFQEWINKKTILKFELCQTH